MASWKKPVRASYRSEKKPRAGATQLPATARPWPSWLVGAGLLVATLAAYHPVWRGGLLWDDDKHVTSAELQPLHGLTRIWFDLGATQQYYPVTHSVFWIEHRLWGDTTLPYHLVNIGLHVLSAFLLLVILRRLDIPGAEFAAALFALHPVQVQSVAWISELKNTLSGVLFLLAAWVSLRFDAKRSARDYSASLGLFAAALLAKSVTAVLPGALLVVCWWRRGRLDWRRDVVPTLPFFALGAAAGLFTAWVERTYIGAQGAEFHSSPVQRVLIAGRALWFYLGKIFWPRELNFEYPRWSIDPTAVWQYAYPLGMLVLLIACSCLRSRSRAPLAAVLLFGGILFPALGFLNVFPFRYSFVADHFQYLATIPIFALVSAFGVIAFDRWVSSRRWVPIAASLGLLAALGIITWNQSHDYTDAVTLYRSILARNPTSWLAHSNLGALLRPSAPDEALTHLTEAVRLKPDSDVGHYNLANLYQQSGRLDDAVREYRETIRLSPGMALAHYNLGNTLLQMNHLQEAQSAYYEAIRTDPNLALAYGGLCRALQAMGRPDEARRSCETAIKLQPDLAVLHYDYAGVLQAQEQLDRAAAEYTTAVRLRPDSVEAQNDLGSILQQLGRLDQAKQHYEAALALNADLGLTHGALCSTLQMLRRLDEARRECETAIRLQPDLAVGRYDLGNILQQQGRHQEAVAQYLEALRLDPEFPEAHFNAATSLEALGRSAEARYHTTQATAGLPDPAAHSVRGAALEGQGRLTEAREEYARALQLEPGLAVARQGITRVDAALQLPASSSQLPAPRREE
jgi:tetratricopeptide (TPR) repeat protein